MQYDMSPGEPEKVFMWCEGPHSDLEEFPEQPLLLSCKHVLSSLLRFYGLMWVSKHLSIKTMSASCNM